MVAKHIKITGFHQSGESEELGIYIIEVSEIGELLEHIKAQHKYIVRIVVDIAL